ncbi:hypothetical protein [Commensalibacter nepenthis]|uniref:Uncharacterized protein n=1 Tax=Commensalibacter nepenthis TaxID=3043872 RepID=A0ABT6Q7T4_9PROT|nr:hypothetical protein [Commensalibacter sp. TBRC 10068]MDI2112962.1 hypothetical protein [Commensalibacter sp. TBRC 10068]
MLNIKMIFMVFVFVGLLTNSLSAIARPSSDVKTIEQMNVLLDFLYGSHHGYQVFVNQLKEDIAHQNKGGVAEFVKYPLTINLNNKPVAIKNTQQFIQNYEAIITPKVKGAVAKQQFIGMFANGQGMMFGSGQLWISGYCLDKTCKDPTQMKIYIKAINN